MGGVGKTRLALEAAGTTARNYAGGAWLVELASLADSGLVAQAVAAGLGMPEEPGVASETSLARGAYKGRLLLVLDNCEHLIDACAEVALLLLRS
jgi:predicted ATPase